MIVRITLNQPVTITDVEVLTELHVETEVVDTGDRLAAAGLGRVDGQVAFLDPSALRRAGRDSPTADWPERFDAMVGYAAARGWVGEDGFLHAHIVGSA